jgi:hypothetical protein
MFALLIDTSQSMARSIDVVRGLPPVLLIVGGVAEGR